MNTRLTPIALSQEPPVEVLPGIFIPAEEMDNWLHTMQNDADAAEMAEDILVERSAGDSLSEESIIEVPFWFLAEIEEHLAVLLLQRSAANRSEAQRVRHMAGFAVNFGSNIPQ